MLIRRLLASKEEVKSLRIAGKNLGINIKVSNKIPIKYKEWGRVKVRKNNVPYGLYYVTLTCPKDNKEQLKTLVKLWRTRICYLDA